MKRIRLCALFLAVLMLLPLTVGCKKEEKPVVVDASYKIVYRKDDVYASRAAMSLCGAMGKVLEERPEVLSEKEYDAASEGGAIYIGVVPEGATPLADKDFSVELLDGDIVIQGADSLRLYLAVERIAEVWLTEDCGVDAEGALTVSGAICTRLSKLDVGAGRLISVMSQNIRCGEDGNGNNIDDRKGRFVKLMNEYSPDLLGTQEATSKWMGIFKAELGKEYGIVGCSRDGENATSGEWNAILYKKSRFELRESGTFWLTDTPNVPSFTVEGASHRRICTWAILYDKVTEQEILFCNTHLDHQSDEIRVKQTEYLMSFMNQYAGKYPIFLTGDFNAAVGSGPYNKVVGKLSDCHKKAELDLSDVKGTFHGYSSTPKSEIDFCFFDKSKADAVTFRIQSEWYSGYVSDHYGVIGNFILK